MNAKGFVGIFDQPHTDDAIEAFVKSWLSRFEKVEQVVPTETMTLRIESIEEIMWEEHMQFRIINGEQFSWVYLSKDHRGIETTGFEDAEISLCLDLLLELPGVREVVDEKNERRLEQLEREGVI